MNRAQIVIGRKPVLEALRKGEGAEKLYIGRDRDTGSLKAIQALAREQGVRVQMCDREKLDRLAEGGLHQGVVLLATSVAYRSLDDLFVIAEQRGEPPFFAVLDRIQDPHNYGAILRSAEVAGVHGVIVPERGAAPMTAVVHKASAGATQHIAICRVTNITDAVLKLKKRGVWVYGADASGAPYTKTDLTGPVALIIGNEEKGIGQALRKHTDGLIALPVRGKVDSLNASNAAAVLFYEVLRQKHVR